MWYRRVRRSARGDTDCRQRATALEYRGYDSAGIAVIQNGHIDIRRDVGKLANLISLLAEQPINGHLAVGHTRWATHGKPSQQNAHPHSDDSGEIVVVQNGIVENFRELRDSLQAEGFDFHSETDTEVIVHLIALHYSPTGGLAEAVRKALGYLKGPSAIVALTSREPDKLVAARLGNAGGVTIGLGEGEMFIASDIPAILEHTRRMIFLEDRQMAVVTRDGVQIETLDGEAVKPEIHDIPWDPISAAKGEYRHFMQKEIFEQARSITDTIRGRVDFAAGEVYFEDMQLTEERAHSFDRIVIVACGTSAYAALVGKFMLEQLARIPVEVDYGSEFRYRDPIIDERTLLLAITQSGETVDTLAAMEEGRAKGAYLCSIVNVIGSQAARISDGVIYMHAGRRSVWPPPRPSLRRWWTSTCWPSIWRNCASSIGPAARQKLVDDLAQLPDLVGRLLDVNDDRIYQDLAQRFHGYRNFLYLGRGINYPIALEGALKLKEISYIHAEGYPAGEMKHGPIALIDERHAGGGRCAAGCRLRQDDQPDRAGQGARRHRHRGRHRGRRVHRQTADHVIFIPAASPLLTPVLTVIPLQLLAYHIAVRRGADVDQPRNLAKSVTVE